MTVSEQAREAAAKFDHGWEVCRDQMERDALADAFATFEQTIRADERRKTLEEAAERVEKFGRADLQPFVDDAAIAWCGRKERETFPEDITYFEQNWWALQGMQNFVRATAIRALIDTTSKGSDQ